MWKLREEAELYKDLPTKKLKKVIRQYKFLSFANSDIFNFIFSFFSILIPFLFLFNVTTLSLFCLVLFHYLFFWEYLHVYKKSKLVSNSDKKEIDRIIEMLEDYLEDSKNKKPLE